MPTKQTILIVEDEPELSDMLVDYLVAQGYQVLAAAWGEDAVKLSQENTPQLVVIDIGLPDINGYEVARRIQAYHRTRNTPIIFLTQFHERTDRMQGLELGAVDYVTKPYDLQELHLRMRNAMKRAGQEAPSNAITGLPEGRAVDERLSELLGAADWAILVLQVRRMNRFREAYGFVAADDAMRAVAAIFKETAQQGGPADDLVCHLTAENLLVITTAAHAPEMEQRVRERLQQSVDLFYPAMGQAKPVQPGDRLVFVTAVQRAGAFQDIDSLKKALMHLVTAN
jgi:DNA-binding response OmpR family regulator